MPHADVFLISHTSIKSHFWTKRLFHFQTRGMRWNAREVKSRELQLQDQRSVVAHFISNIPVLSDNDQTQKMKRLSFWTLQWSVVSAPQHRLNTRQEVRSAHANKMWRLLSSSSIRHVMLRVLYVMHRFLLEFTAGHILRLPSNLHKLSVRCRFKRVGGGEEGLRGLGGLGGGITRWATAWHSGRLLTASPLLPAPASASEKMARCLCFLWSVLLLEFPEASSCPRCIDLPLLSFSLTGRILVMTNLLQCRWRLVELNRKKKRKEKNAWQTLSDVSLASCTCCWTKPTTSLLLQEGNCWIDAISWNN